MKSKIATARARRLRRDMTLAERKLWHCLRGRQLEGAYFRRQTPIGSYIVDFVCKKRKLIIEVDGGQHFKPEAVKLDAIRTRFFQNQGFRILRFSNNDVLSNLEGVYVTIQSAINSDSALPPS